MTENTEEIRLTTYLAVEMLPRQLPEQVAERVIRGGKVVGTWFRRLEQLGVFDLGGRKFVRFRTDLTETRPLLQHLLGLGHAVAYAGSDGFEVEFPVRKGKISSMVMVGTSDLNRKLYKGPKIKGWEQAFGG